MKALRYYGKGDVRMEDVPEPTIGPGRVLVKPAFTGLCGSDLHLYFHGPIPPNSPASDTEPHPLTGETLPVTLGHEFSGTIVEVGEGVTGLKPGDPVAIDPVSGCGECTACKAGRYNACGKMACLGISGGGGGLSELISVPAEKAHPIGDIPLDQAALFDPLCVGYHGVTKSGAKAGDVVLVGGAGPVGLLTAAVAKGVGAKVIITELAANRRAFAEEAGVADRVVDPGSEDLQAIVAEMTDGEGVDIAYECVGVGAIVEPLINALKIGGHLEILGVHTEPVPIDLVTMLFKELTMAGSVGYANAFPGAIKMVQDGKIDLGPFITSRVKADNFVTDGLEYLEKHKDDQIKMVVEF
ncbi:2,3-butanediol dehydrogenase [Gordonia sp. (in: high G+C Gram-positive bacteria)]|uniref:2,3-butanediol dehydrogenase n=1 Tax=Gordonia sp. (in: high G+C Gram-positive bacteria) TaxID=84139 RepID=UPI0039E35516